MKYVYYAFRFWSVIKTIMTDWLFFSPEREIIFFNALKTKCAIFVAYPCSYHMCYVLLFGWKSVSYIHTYPCMHTCIHTHTCTHAYILMHTYTLIHTNINIHIHTHKYINTCAECFQAQNDIHAHAYSYIHMHTYVRTYIHKYVCRMFPCTNDIHKPSNDSVPTQKRLEFVHSWYTYSYILIHTHTHTHINTCVCRMFPCTNDTHKPSNDSVPTQKRLEFVV
jgi:hypothetical protein